MTTGLTYQELSTVYINSADWFVIRRISKKKKKKKKLTIKEKEKKEEKKRCNIHLFI